MNRPDNVNLIERYEREARWNRPDWDAFLDEAERCPVEIVYEVEECGYPHAFDFDMMLIAVEEWLMDPRTSRPTRYFPPPNAADRRDLYTGKVTA